ncbi:MAG TPA: chalcone isomerase family protein [Casimicrobiaceae bacterium]|nr:chalcone isomerase family protein [Casimicrobiaceae bacterium]
MRKLVAIVCALAFVAGAQAADVGGVKLNDKESVGGQELVLNGAGIRTKLMFKVYVGSLYLPAKATTAAAVYAKGPRRVQLNMLRDVTADQMMDALSEGVTNGNPAADVAAVKAQTAELATIMKSIGPLKEGNVVTFDFVDGGTKVSFNGAAKGTIAGEAFNKALMNAWIGDSPVQADLKKAMLGG